MDFFQTVEADVKAAVGWVESEADTALKAIWAAAKPIFVSVEPTIIQTVMTAVTSFLATAEADVAKGGFDDIEQAFLEDLEVAGSELFTTAKGLGSTLLQVIIGLVKGATPPDA